MREIYYLTKRNMLLFLRDKGAVFFSILSMLIVLALMVIFLGNMNCENVVEALAEAGGVRDTAADRKNAEYLIKMWTLAGILMTNAVTVTLTVMGAMVQDETGNRLMSFYAAPVKRNRLAMGYILSSWLVGTGMCILTLFAGEIYMGLSGFPLLPVSDCAALFMMIMLNTFVWAAVAYLLALCIHSESAWSGVLTIVGTLVGFVGAIYLPMSMLPKGVANVLKHLPVLHGAAMMRAVCTQDAVETTFGGLPEMAGDTFREQMGVHVIMNGKVVSVEQQVLFLAACGIIAAAAAALLGRKRRIAER